MVALSVSISAIELPAKNDWHSATLQVEMIPEDIMDERAGMGIIMW